MVHGLLFAELGDRRKHTAGVAGKKDNVLGVLRGDAGNLGVLDILDRVGAARVLCQCVIIVIDHAGCGVEDDVFQDGTKANGAEDVGLLLSRKANALGVASTFDVEDARVAPAVLVITDEGTLGISRQGGLASA